MRIWLVNLLFIGYIFSCSAQTFVPDANERANRKLFRNLFLKYDSVIAYSLACSFQPEKIKAVVHENNRWFLLETEVEIINPFTKNASYKILKAPIHLSDVTETVRTYVDSLSTNQFGAINYDSLNKDYHFKGGQKVWTPIADGCGERITYITQDSYISLYASNADSQQKNIYTADRHRFIKCRNLFIALFNIE